jgi:hypothetical protein
LPKKLDEKNKELANNAIKMMQASEIFQTTQKELKEMDPKYEDDRKMISRIIMDFKKGSQALNKSEFEKLFIETDEDFYKKLLDKYPSLTKNELRLCVFLRQNLSSKEISAITQQSPHSIVVARSRLRKSLVWRSLRASAISDSILVQNIDIITISIESIKKAVSFRNSLYICWSIYSLINLILSTVLFGLVKLSIYTPFF